MSNIKDLIILKTVEKYEHKGKVIYKMLKDKEIPVFIKFWGDKICCFLDTSKSNMLWNVLYTEEFYEKYIEKQDKSLKVIEYSKRRYGEPKLTKPPMLRGIMPVFSIMMIGRKNQIYIQNNDVWIKANDYFSEDISQEEAIEKGIKVKIREKLCYKNNYVAVTLRGEGWICIQNLLLFLDDNDIYRRLNNKVCELYNWEYTDMPLEWERFYEELINKLRIERCERCYARAS